MPAVQPVKPFKIFDNVAVVGTTFVQATALLTSKGVILIDAMGSPDDARKIIIPGLRAVGVNPTHIKYVVAAHGHDDHFGGAQYLADTYGARVMMHKADWDLIAKERPEHAPKRDLEITDGQKLTLGDTTIVFHHTPGHTPVPSRPSSRSAGRAAATPRSCGAAPTRPPRRRPSERTCPPYVRPPSRCVRPAWTSS